MHAVPAVQEKFCMEKFITGKKAFWFFPGSKKAVWLLLGVEARNFVKNIQNLILLIYFV